MRPYHLLQITDCHLGSQPDETLLGLNTDESLRDVLDVLRAQENPDLLLVTGDISNDGGARSYERYIDFIKEYFPNTPLAWLPGNHDEPVNMAKVDEVPIELCLRVPGWNLIFLDSKIPYEEGGELQSEELQRLDDELSQAPDVPTLVFLHHQVVPVGSAWVDQYTVKNSHELFAVLDKYDNVKAVSWGHVHQEFAKTRRGVDLLATPSTCVQFTPNHDEFQVDRAMPGYRQYKLYPDGRYTTCVVRAAIKKYDIDFAATGY